MSSRGFCVALICGVISTSVSAEVVPLQPVRPWIVRYDTAECNAQRSYGEKANPIILALRPSIAGSSFDLLLFTRGRGPKFAKESEGSVDFGGGPISAWVLHYESKAPTTFSIFKFRIGSEQMAQANSATSVIFHVKGQADVAFSLAAVPNLLSKLNGCTADLRHHWNMIEPERDTVATPPVGDVRALFSSDDYPDEAITHNQQGTVQYLLLVDERGGVAACDVLQPSGVPVLDGMGCKVIRERAKFKPALDRNGTAVRSSMITPPITWLFEN